MALVITEIPKAFTNTEHRNSAYLLNNSFLIICMFLKLRKCIAFMRLYDVIIETIFGFIRNNSIFAILLGVKWIYIKL